jgi:hypothetical protein
MQPSQYKRIARILKELRQELEKDALKEGVPITSSTFNEAYEAIRTSILEREGFTIEQYKQASEGVKTERETKKKEETEVSKKQNEGLEKVLDRVTQIKGDKGDRGDTVVGPMGPQGPEGKPGKNGRDGKNGKDSTVPGPKGDKGDKGDPGEMGMVDVATIAYLEDSIKTVESKITAVEPETVEQFESKLEQSIKISNLKGEMSRLQRTDLGLRQDVDEKITGVNTHKLTVSATEPANPQLNDLWVDIS